MTIVSLSNSFIFVKTTKTAGTSLEVHLAGFCSSRDIVTPIYPPNRDHIPRNHGDSFYNHMPAERIRELMPAKFQESYKFCFERHPVDKCLSHYAMLRNSAVHRRPDRPQSWESYLERGDFPIDTSKYCSAAGDVLVDRIYRYEDIENAVRDIGERLGLTIGSLTTREKSGFRVGVPTAAEVSRNPAQTARIMDAFAESLRITPYDEWAGCRGESMMRERRVRFS